MKKIHIGFEFFQSFILQLREGVSEEALDQSIVKEGSNFNLSKFGARSLNAIQPKVEEQEGFSNIIVYNPSTQQFGRKNADYRKSYSFANLKIFELSEKGEKTFLAYAKKLPIECVLVFSSLPSGGEITPEMLCIFDNHQPKKPLGIYTKSSPLSTDLMTDPGLFNLLEKSLLSILRTKATSFVKKEGELAQKKEQEGIKPKEVRQVSMFLSSSSSLLKNLNWYKVKRVLVNWALDDAHKI